ncbi:MAG: organic solvent ABC transporter substrate-binding protein [Flavobacterium sp. BFFFF2]|nr:MAG: organic solvent ABC transporter substrate-binding protein [Flavobacterium sp. BFFFF2]
MKLTREIKTAILAITSILLFIYGYSFLKGNDLFETHKTFFVEYDNVDGLSKSAPITLNGLMIGKVNKISFANLQGKILVEIRLDTDFEFSKKSQAVIYEPGFIGGKQIMIVPDITDQTKAVSGDTLSGYIRGGMTENVMKKLEPLQEKVELMMVDAGLLLKNVNSILDESTKKSLKNSIIEVEQTLTHFKELSIELKVILNDNKTHLNHSLANLDKTTANFSKISDSLAQAPIGKTIRTLDATLQKADLLLADIQAGKGSLGKLAKDEALYTNFTKTTKELELLLQDLRLNPTRYINVSLFGKKNKPYAAPAAQ